MSGVKEVVDLTEALMDIEIVENVMVKGLRPLEKDELRDIKINELLKDDKKSSIFDKVKKLIGN